jgi:hypothetical protein
MSFGIKASIRTGAIPVRAGVGVLGDGALRLDVEVPQLAGPGVYEAWAPPTPAPVNPCPAPRGRQVTRCEKECAGRGECVGICTLTPGPLGGCLLSVLCIPCSGQALSLGESDESGIVS